MTRKQLKAYKTYSVAQQRYNSALASSGKASEKTKADLLRAIDGICKAVPKNKRTAT